MNIDDKDKLLRDSLNSLFTFAIGLVRVREDAEDLVQAAAEKALRAKKSPDDSSGYRRWLFRILRNTFIDTYRQSRQLEGVEYTENTRVPSADGRDLVDILTVKQSLQQLNLEYREIIYLIDIAGFSYAEAAETLGIPIGTVMSRLSRARKSLLAVINGQQGRIVKLERGRQKSG